MKDIEGAKVVFWLVKELGEVSVNKLMKLMYIYEVITGNDFDYTLYHSGPHSRRVIWFINIAKYLKWVEEYYDQTLLLKPLKADIEPIEKIDIAKQYGIFSTVELSIITTALYMKKEFGSSDEEIANHIKSLKSDKDARWINNLIQEADKLLQKSEGV